MNDVDNMKLCCLREPANAKALDTISQWVKLYGPTIARRLHAEALRCCGGTP